ncbi:dynamin family protein [Thiosulfativibrio zosterae]|uniref:Dynamin N-terminal domain-containing protein n=1 Tax=Thiosulfativibrio zosterae TaxID=2675053 RepID=A0A6F8PR85_9GAMM|nr:dynamin family protein [Thiosulfativibrio zosterae]BBP44625.1 hypothetical protein THMIRHAT_23710 [Thiosulfativibrio zosterae]
MTPHERYVKLEQHLAQENPVLLDIIKTYQALDKVGYKTGLLNRDQSYATDISWWPLISVLGTFSAGKSSFINQYTGKAVQSTGNQAVDDKFTVICYGSGDEVNTLPGLALNADPRFPFFGISEEINKVEQGEGQRIDSYLQLKTVPSEILKGKILIDSPGFDADSQRNATLRITNHIMDMSDLVLVFFDARHPEPGAMRDTLQHLVATSVGRHDADKILFILNQIDTAAQEDNPEEVIGSWQRAIAQEGLIAGNFYAIYNEALSNKIADEALANRFKRKKNVDLARIESRMEKVSTERAYRIAHGAQHIAEELETVKLPLLKQAIKSWRRKVLTLDIVIFGAILVAMVWGGMQMPNFVANVQAWLLSDIIYGGSAAFIALILVFMGHFTFRKKMAVWDAKRLSQTHPDIANALLYNNRFWRGMHHALPRGWGSKTSTQLTKIVKSSKDAIQKLTDQFADPSGHLKAKKESEAVAALEALKASEAEHQAALAKAQPKLELPAEKVETVIEEVQPVAEVTAPEKVEASAKA